MVLSTLGANPALAESPTIEIEDKPKTIQEIVEQEFKDIPIMIEIAKCESRYRQFDENGNVLKGKVDNRDTGVFQINKHYHLDTALKLGLDIYTLEGNMAYARYLYENEGSQPWNASSGCWGKYREVALK